MPVSRKLDAGSSIGGYQLTDRLGAGAAGTVFAARDSETGQRVAMKVLRSGAEANEEIHARFIREISVAQKLGDPHVVEYHDCGVEDGVLYYVMEYVPWGSLAEALQSGGVLPWRDACECALQICRGLSHLHESGIVHRDLKPANIFLSDDGQLKLGDFGLARDSAAHRLTVSGTTVGTAKYLSPEQALGEHDIDARTDLYALGCNLFEFIVGRPPFAGSDSETPVDLIEMMRRHIEEPPPSLSDVAPGCPPELSQLVDRLLSKQRDQRPESAVEVAEELDRILKKYDSRGEGDSDSAEPLTHRLRPQSAAAQVSTTRLIAIVAIVVLMIVVALLYRAVAS